MVSDRIRRIRTLNTCLIALFSSISRALNQILDTWEDRVWFGNMFQEVFDMFRIFSVILETVEEVADVLKVILDAVVVVSDVQFFFNLPNQISRCLVSIFAISNEPRTPA